MAWRTAVNVTVFKDEIKKKIKRHLGGEVKTDALDQLIADYLDDSIRAVAGAHTWTWRRLDPEELLAAPGAETPYVAIPFYIDQYAEFVLSQQGDADTVPLAYIPPGEFIRRDCQNPDAATTIIGYTVMSDRFYFYPPVWGGSPNPMAAIDIFGHISAYQLEDYDEVPNGDPDIFGIWRRIPDGFAPCLEKGALALMDLLEAEIVHKWQEKYDKELERLIQADETSFAEGGK